MANRAVPMLDDFDESMKIRRSCWIVEERDGDFFCNCPKGRHEDKSYGYFISLYFCTLITFIALGYSCVLLTGLVSRKFCHTACNKSYYRNIFLGPPSNHDGKLYGCLKSFLNTFVAIVFTCLFMRSFNWICFSKLLQHNTHSNCMENYLHIPCIQIPYSNISEGMKFIYMDA